jgi:hypothetical protein
MAESVTRTRLILRKLKQQKFFYVTSSCSRDNLNNCCYFERSLLAENELRRKEKGVESQMYDARDKTTDACDKYHFLNDWRLYVHYIMSFTVSFPK